MFPHDGVFNVMARLSSHGVICADLPFTPVVVSGGDVAGQNKPVQQ